MDPVTASLAAEKVASLAVRETMDVLAQKEVAMLLQQQEALRLGEITVREIAHGDAIAEREAAAVEEMQARLDAEARDAMPTAERGPEDHARPGDSVPDHRESVPGTNYELTEERSRLVESISSAEKTIYENSGVDLANPVREQLADQLVDVFRNQQILPDLVGPDAQTNLERMESGLAPYIDSDGRLSKVELHHHQQQHEGPLVELDAVSHRSHHSDLHPRLEKGEGRGEDPLWSQKVAEHWKQRAAEFLTAA